VANFRDLPRDVQQERMADDNLLLQVAIAGSSMLRDLFFTTTREEILEVEPFDMFNSVFFPDMPSELNFDDIKEEIVRRVGKPQGHVPNVQLNEARNMVVATFTTDEPLPHMGKIHQGVLGALQLAKVKGKKLYEFVKKAPVQQQQQQQQKPSFDASVPHRLENFVSPNSFSVMPLTSEKPLFNMKRLLWNMRKDLLPIHRDQIEFNMLCIVYDRPVWDQDSYHRGEIRSLISSTVREKETVLIKCVDSGKTSWFLLKDIFHMPLNPAITDVPPMAISCNLVTLAPPPLSGYDWSMKSKFAFSNVVKNFFYNKLFLDVSHIDDKGVLQVTNIRGTFSTRGSSVVKSLLASGHAISCPSSMPPPPIVQPLLEEESFTLPGPVSPLQMIVKPYNRSCNQYKVSY
jgi:hypothetical protein